MSRQRNHTPTYRYHKQSGQAVCDFHDPLTGKKRCVSLGRWNSAESKREHARIVAEVAVGRPGRRDGLTVNELFLAFLKHAEGYYRSPDGGPTPELKNLKLSVRAARDTHGHTPAAEFGPLALKAVRQKMIDRGLCRARVNKDVTRLKHVFKWGVSEQLIPPTVYEGLRAVAGLRAGRSAARETDPVGPVPVAVYEATLPHLPRVPRALVVFLRHTGCRPGEACRLSLGELDRTGDVWAYRPSRHKTRHRGKGRLIPVGPKAQDVLAAYLAGRCPAPAITFDPSDPDQRRSAAVEYEKAHRPVDAALLRDTAKAVVVVNGYVADPTAPLFDPARDRLERYAEIRTKRKSKVTPCQVCRKKATPKRAPRPLYTTPALHNAVERAAKKAKVDPWHPNQLRHLRGTEVRAAFGLEAAQVLLGHARADVTQVYAEKNEALAATVAKAVG